MRVLTGFSRVRERSRGIVLRIRSRTRCEFLIRFRRPSEVFQDLISDNETFRLRSRARLTNTRNGRRLRIFHGLPRGLTGKLFEPSAGTSGPVFYSQFSSLERLIESSRLRHSRFSSSRAMKSASNLPRAKGDTVFELSFETIFRVFWTTSSLYKLVTENLTFTHCNGELEHIREKIELSVEILLCLNRAFNVQMTPFSIFSRLCRIYRITGTFCNAYDRVERATCK